MIPDSAPGAHRRRPRTAFAWALLIVSVGVLLLALTLVPFGRVQTTGDGSGLVGRPAPPLSAVDLNGRRWSLTDGQGRLVWINYWATWCPPCRTEMPTMQRLAETYGDRLLILGVDFGEDPATVRDFIDRYQITYPILLDPQLENFYRWNPQFGLPRHFFVDTRGVVLRAIIGELPPGQMVEIVKSLLGPA